MLCNITYNYIRLSGFLRGDLNLFQAERGAATGVYSLSTGTAGKLTAYRVDSGAIHYVRNGTTYTAALQTPSLPERITGSKTVSKQ